MVKVIFLGGFGDIIENAMICNYGRLCKGAVIETARIT